MKKKDFTKLVLRNLESKKTLYCRIWEGYDDGAIKFWLDVYLVIDDTFYSIYSSDSTTSYSSLVPLQKRWKYKLKSWINTNWNIDIILDRVSV